MEKDLPREEKEVITTKKIRIFPENESRFHTATTVFRRAYNLTIEAFKVRNEKKPSKAAIVSQVIKEFSNENFKVPYDLCGEAFRKACETHKRVMRERKVKRKCDYNFMSYKYSPHYFQIIKMREKIWKNFLGTFSYSEELPKEALLKMATIHYENGEWYVCVQKFTKVKPINKINGNIVSLDPGVRTFQTSYNESQVIKYGNDFFSNKIFPLLLKVDKLYGKRQNLENVRKDYGDYQWFKDRLKYYNRKINKYKARFNHLINDLHNRVAYDLVNNYDIILLPTFETSNMILKDQRKIRSKTVRSMIGLKHFKFKLKLRWYAEKYGKIVIDVNEAYTSKTYNGKIFKIGSKEQFNVKLKNPNKTKIVDRDINGARNILLRFISKRIN
jgi:putative transposase